MSYTNQQLELKAHIEKENEAFAAECKARGSVFWTTTVADIDFWADIGVTTVAQYEHYQARSTHWDLYKDINGIRPRFMDYDSMTVEQINAEIELLCGNEEKELEREKQLKEANAYKPNLVFDGLDKLLEV